MQMIMNVSQAARQLGRSERWLREAERRGKIPRARRDLNGWRVYDESDIARLRELLIPPDGTNGETEDAIRNESAIKYKS